VTVHARSGIGKSALLRSFAAETAEAGAGRVWSGRCYERESMPYKAFDGIIDALVDDLRERELPLTHFCDPAEVHALVRLFPALGRLAGVRHTSLAVPARPSPELRDRAYAALQRVLARVSEDVPLVLVIDDLQWCDADSVRLLAELVRPPSSPRMLLVGAYRDDALFPDTPLARALARLHRSRPDLATVDVNLDPLDQTAARSLAASLLAEYDIEQPTLDASLARESEGSPLFLRELVEHARSQAAPTVRAGASSRNVPDLDEVLAARVADLSSEARSLLETIAIAGRPVEQRTAVHAALGQGATVTPIDVLRRARLVAASGFTDRDWIEPAHEHVRRYVLDALGPEERRVRHLSLARAMAGVASSEPEALATHFARGGAHELAALHALHAAALASEGLAFDLAVHWYELALAHLPEDDERRLETQTALGHALANTGRGYEGAQAILRAARSAPPEKARPLRRLAAHWLVYSGMMGEGRQLLLELLDEAGLPFPRSRASAIATFLALRTRIRLRGLAYQERSAAEVPEDLLHRIDLCWALGLLLNSEPVESAGFLARHLLLALEAGEPTRIAPALAYETVGRVMSGRLGADEAERELEVASELAARTGDDEAVAWVDFIHPVVATTAGDWRRGLDRAQHAVRSLQAHTVGSGLPILTCRHLEMWCRFQLGQWATLAPLVHRMIAAGGRANPHRASAQDLLAFPLALANDQPELALRTLGPGEGVPDAGTDRAIPFRFAARVFVHLYEGDSASAWAGVQSQRRRLERSLRFRPAISKSFYLWGSLAAAAARAADGDPSVIPRARKDARRLGQLAFRPAATLARLAEAGLEAASGNRQLAASEYEAAARGFDELGMAMHHAVARHRRGAIIGGTEGAALQEQARDTMRAAGVVDPDRLAAALAPGLH
jgi:hypothetical protein